MLSHVTLCLIVDLIARTHICVQIFTYLNGINADQNNRFIFTSATVKRIAGIHLYRISRVQFTRNTERTDTKKKVDTVAKRIGLFTTYKALKL